MCENVTHGDNFLMFTAGMSELVGNVAPIQHVELMCERGLSFGLLDSFHTTTILICKKNCGSGIRFEISTLAQIYKMPCELYTYQRKARPARLQSCVKT